MKTSTKIAIRKAKKSIWSIYLIVGLVLMSTPLFAQEVEFRPIPAFHWSSYVGLTTYAGEFDASATDRSAVGFGLSNALTYQMSQALGIGVGHTLAFHPRIPDPASRHNVQAYLMLQHPRKRVTPFFKIGVSNTFGGTQNGIGPHVGFGLNIISSGTFSLYQETTFNVVYPGKALDGVDLSGSFDTIGTVGVGIRITDISGFFGTRDVGLQDIFTSAESTGYVVKPGQIVSFSTEANSKNIDFSWDFGDGIKQLGQKVEHNFEKAGVFEITVLAQNAGVSERRSIFLNVQEGAADLTSDLAQNIRSKIPTGEQAFNPDLRADVVTDLGREDVMQMETVIRPENERRTKLEREQKEKDRMAEIVEERLERQRRTSGRQERKEQERLARIEEEKIELNRIEQELKLREEADRAEKMRLAELEQQRIEEERIAAALKADLEEQKKLEEERLELELQEAESEEQKAARIALEQEQERLAIIEADRLEKDRVEAAEKARLETERLAKLEAEKLEQERLAQAEQDRIRSERIAKLEADRLRQDNIEQEKEAKRIADQAEKERIESERREREQREQELQAEREEEARIQKELNEKAEQLRLEKELETQREQERLDKIEADRLETEQLAKEEAERLRIEAEEEEKNRDLIERQEKEKEEADRLEKERQAAIVAVEAARLSVEEELRLEKEEQKNQEDEIFDAAIRVPGEGQYTWVLKTFTSLDDARSMVSTLGEMGYILTIEPSDSMYRLYKLHSQDASGSIVYNVAWGAFDDRDAGLTAADNLPPEYERPWMIEVKR